MLEMLEPWQSFAGQPDFATGIERELLTELVPGHPLYGVPVRAAARTGASDDFLFEILDGSGHVAVVHLTWAQRPEFLPCPDTEFYSSLELWAERRMRPDHREWRGEE